MEHETSESSASERCLNCRAPLQDAFCAACGQSAATQRLRLRSILSDAASHLFSLDSKAWNTVLGLSRRPGEMCRDYVAGQRIPYLTPIRYFLSVLAIVLLVNLLLGFDPAAVGPIEGMSPKQEEIRQVAGTFAMEHLDLAMLVLVPFYALLIRRLYRRSQLTYAEVGAFVLFIHGHLMLLGLPLAPFEERFLVPVLIFKMILQVAYLSWASVAFFAATVRAAIVKSIVAAVSYHVMLVAVITFMTLFIVVSNLSSTP